MIAPDIRQHMLNTYRSLRLVIVFVTLAFLTTMGVYRESGADPVGRRTSISAYYHHSNAGFPMKDVFVGSFCAVAVLLIAYQGYRDSESRALNLGGLGLLVVVAFPMSWPDADGNWIGTERDPVHYSGAAVFFFAIAYVCLFRAVDTLDAVMKDEKKEVRYEYRNRYPVFHRLYHLTGLLMVAVPVVSLVIYKFGNPGWVYLFECSGVGVFVLYWVIKSVELWGTELETPQGVDAAQYKVTH